MDLKTTLEQIEILKNDITERIESSDKLENEVAENMKEIRIKEVEYKDLVMSGKDIEADKFYSKIEQIKADNKAKLHRNEVIKSNSADLVKDKWIKIHDLSSGLGDLYYQENQKVLGKYLDAKKEMEQAKQELNKITNEYNVNQYSLTVQNDRDFKRFDINKLLIFPRGNPFYKHFSEVQ